MRGILPRRDSAHGAWQLIRPTLLLLAGAWVAAVPALGQQTDPPADALGEATLFQEVPRVSAASKYEQDPREAPASISVITQEEIQRFGYRTLAEVLNSVRGFFTSYDRNYTLCRRARVHAPRRL